MVIKVYISGISASKEIKKRQQRALLILDSCKVDYESIDITEPGLEEMREFMVQNSKIREPNKTPLSPQFFNDDIYCGDYEDFDSAVEVNEVFPFLKLESNGTDFQYSLNNMKTTNGEHEEDVTRKSISPEKMENDQKEENEEGEVTKDIKDETGDAEAKDGEEEAEDDEFWAQDDSKKRKKDEDEVVEETNESKEDGNEAEDASKRLKTDGEEEKNAEIEEEEEEEEEDEEAEIVEVKPSEVETEKMEKKKDEEVVKEEEEEEDDDFWAGKGN